MAETGRPLLELFPPGGSIPCDSVFPNVPILPVSKSSAELAEVPLQPEECPKSSSKAPRSENVPEDNSHIKPKAAMHTAGCAVDSSAVRSAARPHSIAEVHIPDGAGAPRGVSVTHQSERGFAGNVSSLQRNLGQQILAPAKLPVQRSLSDSRQTQKGGHTSARESSGPMCLGRSADLSIQPLACMQAMQLQHSCTSTTFCRVGNICSGSPSQQGCSASARSSSQAAGELSRDTNHSRLEEAMCCSSYPHLAMEDTFAAYCHPQPIPTPAQLLLQKVAPEGDFKGQGGGSTLLALPPLISSISESGLDAKHLLHCCSLDCNWPGPLRHGGSRQQVWDKSKATRDAATMTSRMELRDAGVQVDQEGPEGPEKQAQHVFPELCLADEGPAARRKSPVREVMWDAEGMTWEVYGASVDPEELGLAIQKHLELQIKETAERAVKPSRQSMSLDSDEKDQHRRRRRRRRSLMASLRPPGCCSRTTTAAD